MSSGDRTGREAKLVERVEALIARVGDDGASDLGGGRREATEIVDELRPLLRAIAFLGASGTTRSAVADGGDGRPEHWSGAVGVPGELGGFAIVREIGRGGWGSSSRRSRWRRGVGSR